MKIEYLIFPNAMTDFNEKLFDLKSLTSSRNDLSIRDNEIIYKGLSYTVDYHLDKGYASKKNIQYYDMSIIIESAGGIELLVHLDDSLHLNIDKNKYTLTPVWSDISLFYSQKGYTLVYEIENLIRQLINKFLFLNAGDNWIEDFIPCKLKDKYPQINKKPHDFIYNLNFSDLSSFLFEPLNTHSSMETNWNLFFKEVIHCEGDEIRRPLKDIYSRRCKIAHNNFFKKEDYEKIHGIYSKIKPIIQNALSHLVMHSIAPKDIVRQKETDAIEKYAGNKNLLGYFFKIVSSLEYCVVELAISFDMPTSQMTFSEWGNIEKHLDMLLKREKIPASLKDEIALIRQEKTDLLDRDESHALDEHLSSLKEKAVHAQHQIAAIRDKLVDL